MVQNRYTTLGIAPADDDVVQVTSSHNRPRVGRKEQGGGRSMYIDIYLDIDVDRQIDR